MRIMKLLFLAALFCLAVTQTYPGVFAFSWQAGFCAYQEQLKHQKCDPSLISLWDNQSFTIHGLWPTLNSTSSYGSFNVDLLSQKLSLLDDMHNYWPPKSKPSSTNVFLWDHEWTTHGKDYANIVYRLRPEDFPGSEEQRNSALQLSFYADVIAFYKKFNVKKLPFKNCTKTEFARYMGITQNQFNFMCSKGTILREVQVCFQMTKTGINIANCLRTTTSCSGSGLYVDLSNWSVKPQSRVYNYPKSRNLETQLISE